VAEPGNNLAISRHGSGSSRRRIRRELAQAGHPAALRPPKRVSIEPRTRCSDNGRSIGTNAESLAIGNWRRQRAQTHQALASGPPKRLVIGGSVRLTSPDNDTPITGYTPRFTQK